MSEQKVLCPYCGHSMRPGLQRYDDLKVIRNAYCERCGSSGPAAMYEGTEQFTSAARRIVDRLGSMAMQRALERPLQKPLTLEELNECDIFYIEFKELNEGNFIPVQFSPESHFRGMLTYHRPGWATHFSIEMFGCGRYWRCWASRPTVEERAAATWED